MDDYQPTEATRIVESMEAKGNKDTRAREALAMKDEQLKILTDQNKTLLTSLNAMDDEIGALKDERAHLQDENRSLRDQNFELQSKARAAESNMQKAQTGAEEREAQMKTLTDHNTELLRLLEKEESQSTNYSKELTTTKSDLDGLQSRHASLMAAAKTHEEIAIRATKESQLRAEEVRILRNDRDHIEACSTEYKMKTQVEIEALQEQLRVRKEKQYQLLEKMQRQEEAKRQSEDRLSALEEKYRKLHEREQELEMQLQLESTAKRAQVEANKNLSAENAKLINAKNDLQQQLEKCEQERLRLENESRDSAEQLREMAEKVFQLLERLKLAELGKTKAIDALKQKEVEMVGLKKKNARLLKESTEEGKARVKTELDKKVQLEQIQALKKHNQQLSNRCSEEVKAKLKEAEIKKDLEEKLKTMSSRIAFLLNKMQADEEAKIVTKEEMKKMYAQIVTLQEKNAEATQKLISTAESNRVMTEALRSKQDDLDAQKIRTMAMQKQLAELVASAENAGLAGLDGNQDGQYQADRSDDDTALLANSRFYIESKASHAGLMVLKARKAKLESSVYQQSVQFIDKIRINAFLKRAQKSMNTKQLLVERIAIYLSDMMELHEKIGSLNNQITATEDRMSHLSRKVKLVQDRVTIEEDAKRKTLLRYVHEMKSKQLNVLDSNMNSIKLDDNGIGDEEAHAIAAILRGSSNAQELHLKGNTITNEGARAIAAVLGNSGCQLRLVDLRSNHITQDGTRVLAEALERSERVKHVYIHAGGKIEALGTTSVDNCTIEAQITSTNLQDTKDTTGYIGVETVCLVDVRNQTECRVDPFIEREFMDLDRSQDDAKQVKASGKSKTPLKLDMKAIKSKTQSKAITSASKDSSMLLFSRRPLSAAALKRHKEKVQMERRQKLEEAKRLAKQELEWNGRAGGFECSPAFSSARKLPPIASPSRKTAASNEASHDGYDKSERDSEIGRVSRSSSAPVLKEDLRPPSTRSEDPAEDED